MVECFLLNVNEVPWLVGWLCHQKFISLSGPVVIIFQPVRKEASSGQAAYLREIVIKLHASHSLISYLGELGHTVTASCKGSWEI